MKLPSDAVKEYFPFYPGRWLTSRRLRVCSPAARGILIDLMSMAWEDGGVVREDLQVLAQVLATTATELTTILDELQRHKRINLTRDDVNALIITIPQLEEVHSEAIAYIEARRADGHKGAEKRYKAPYRVPIAPLSTDRTGPDRTGQDITPPTPSGVQGEAPKVGQARRTAEPFKHPSPDQVATYSAERGHRISGEVFCDYYGSKGWKVGSTPMKDWQAAVRNWIRRDKEQGKSAYEPPREWTPEMTARAEAAEHQRDERIRKTLGLPPWEGKDAAGV